MNPLKRIKYNAPVILTYAILSLLILGISIITNGLSNRYCFSVYGGSWADPLQYFRLIGHSLGHVNFSHLSSNFILILLIGPMLEERYGSKRLLILIVLTSLVIGLMSVLFQPDIMLLGASGVAFMLVLLSSFASSQNGTVPITLILAVIIYIGRETVQGASNLMGITADNISQISHIVGGVCGILGGVLLNKKETPSIDNKNE